VTHEISFPPERMNAIMAARGCATQSAEDEYFEEEPVPWLDFELLKLNLRPDEIEFLMCLSIGHSQKDAAAMAGHKDYWGRKVLRRLRQDLDPPANRTSDLPHDPP